MKNNNKTGFMVVSSYVGEAGEFQRNISAVVRTKAQATRLSKLVPAYGGHKVTVEAVNMDGRDFFDHISRD